MKKFIKMTKPLTSKNIKKWDKIFDTLCSLKNDHDKLIEFLKSFVNEKSDHGTLRTIMITMKRYPKENKELHEVMEQISKLHPSLIK